MNGLIRFALLLLSVAPPLGWSGIARGQFNALPDANAVWYTHFWDPWTYDWAATYYFAEVPEDTLINDTNYVLLHGYGNWSAWPGIFCGGLYENDQGQVYYYHPNTSQTYLLSDYDVLPGDSVEHVWVGSAFDNDALLRTLYIVAVDTVEIGGSERRAIGLVGSPPELVGYDPVHWWIEGIGGTGGLLETSGMMALDVSGGLECMSQGDSMLWYWGPAGYPGNCLTLGLEELQAPGEPWFHPTLVRDVIYLDIPFGSEGHITVLALDGRVMRREHAQDGTLSSADLVPGMYVLQLLDNRGMTRTGRFVKE